MKIITSLFVGLFFSINLFSNELIELNTRDNVIQKFELIKAENPVASLILFVGDHGVLNLTKNFGSVEYGWGKSNFLVRIKDDLSKKGFNIVVVDAPSDKQDENGMLFGFRDTILHHEDMDKVISYLKEKFNLPVWLVGTSRGTESAASVAINSEVGINGLILTSSISKKNTKGISLPELDLDEITVPVYIAAHKNDNCEATPSSDTPIIKEMLTSAKNVKVEIFEGGEEKAKPCKAKTYHGFFKIEDKVIDGISNYIKSNI